MDTEENRPNGQSLPRRASSQRAVEALSLAAALWEQRLADGWTPPVAEGEGFPWAMVRLSLAALLPGMRDASGWVRRSVASTPHPRPLSRNGGGAGGGGDRPLDADSLTETLLHTVLILAGNTPLLAWSPLAAALLAGHRVTAKMSRDETLWPHLFRDALAEVAPDVAERITLESWPGDDPRTAALVRSADAVVAFGSDSTIDALRALTPATTPFFGFGHAISVGLWTQRKDIEADNDFGDYLTRLQQQSSGFAHDIMMYDQGGCLSPQTIFVEDLGLDHPALGMAQCLASWLPTIADALAISPVTDPAIARAVRTARDMALFDGATVHGDPELRWTILTYPTQQSIPPPIGHGVISLIPISNPSHLTDFFGDLRGKISSVGVAGSIPDDLRTTLRAEGVSRICAPGEMQTPPLDWPNGNLDLLAALLQL